MHITLIGVPLPKIDQKPIENRSEIDPKTVPNRSQIGPKSVQDRLRNRPRCQHRFWTVLGPFSDRFWPALGGLLAASRGSSWGQVGPKIDFWRSWMAFKNEHDAGYLSEPIFGRFGSHLGSRKWSQNRSFIGLKSDHDIKTRVFVLTNKHQWFLHIFGHRGVRKSIKNRSNSCLKAVLS